MNCLTIFIIALIITVVVVTYSAAQGNGYFLKGYPSVTGLIFWFLFIWLVLIFLFGGKPKKYRKDRRNHCHKEDYSSNMSNSDNLPQTKYRCVSVDTTSDRPLNVKFTLDKYDPLQATVFNISLQGNEVLSRQGGSIQVVPEGYNESFNIVIPDVSSMQESGKLLKWVSPGNGTELSITMPSNINKVLVTVTPRTDIRFLGRLCLEVVSNGVIGYLAVFQQGV